MPIRPEEAVRYPDDWRQISAEVKERAGNCCETCAAPNGEEVWRRNKSLVWLPLAAFENDEPGPGWKRVKVVLTVAHLDHHPENCSPENLRAWCQRCHLAWDAKHHAANAALTRSKRRLQGQMSRGEQPLFAIGGQE